MTVETSCIWREIQVIKDGKEVSLRIFVKNLDNVNIDSFIEISVDNRVVYSNN